MNKDHITTEELADFLYQNKESEWINTFAHPFGLEIVHRKSGTYIRETPDRYQGDAVKTAKIFGDINHDNVGLTGKVVIRDKVYSLAPIVSASEFKGTKVKPTITELEKFIEKIDEIVPEIEENEE